jgi:hypothetical protein
VPADTDTLSYLPTIDKWADGINDAYNFVTRHSRVLYARQAATLSQGIAVANAAGMNLDSHCSGLWFRNGLIYDLKWSVRT